MHYFVLSSHIYAARSKDSILLLDSEHDDYVSLIDTAAIYLPKILEYAFEYDETNKMYVCTQDDDTQLAYWITFFLNKNFIVVSDAPHPQPIAPRPCKEGGLSEYQWDTKNAWRPFKHAGIGDICRAFITLCRVHWRMKRQGIRGIVCMINNASNESATHDPSDEECNRLAHAVDAASLLYPKKTFCLGWAATYVALARKKRWRKTQLVIGVQASPFYAHAWAEVAGTVIHDDPIICEVLSIIMKTP